MSDVFDASKYLTKVSGNDYLEVKWRLLWLRTEHPNAIITTELVTMDGNMAIFKATVEIPTEPGGTGGGIGTGHGSEQYGDFRDFIEKAETKALGRALATLGYGTQFSKEFDFGADHGRIVDAPVDLQRQRERSTNRATPTKSAPNASEQAQTYDNASRGANEPLLATERQHAFIRALIHDLDVDEKSLDAECEQVYGTNVANLNRRDASIVIERMNAARSKLAVETLHDDAQTQGQLIDPTDVAAKARS